MRFTEREKTLLITVDQKTQLIKNKVRSVIEGYETGLMLWGDGGIGKSFIVTEEFDRRKVDAEIFNSRISARALVDALKAKPDSIHLIEDAEGLIHDKHASGLLRSALWSQSNKRPPVRRVTWNTHRNPIVFDFTGGIIITSNLNISRKNPDLAAIATRISVLHVDFTNEELLAMMKRVCEQGYTFGELSMNEDECLEVADYIAKQRNDFTSRINMRFLTKGFRAYMQYRQGKSTTHWKELLSADIHGKVAIPLLGRELTIHESLIAGAIRTLGMSVSDQLRLWKEKTGKSNMAYYRALKRL